MHTPAQQAAMAFILSLIGVLAFIWLNTWFGAFSASAVIVALATAGTYFEARR